MPHQVFRGQWPDCFRKCELGKTAKKPRIVNEIQFQKSKFANRKPPESGVENNG